MIFLLFLIQADIDCRLEHGVYACVTKSSHMCCKYQGVTQRRWGMSYSWYQTSLRCRGYLYPFFLHSIVQNRLYSFSYTGIIL
jgi:hypothetical protein